MTDAAGSALNDSNVRGGRKPECWVSVDIDEAYIHCSKHIPLLARLPKKIHWGTDDPAKKGGNYFGIDPDNGE